MLLVMVKRRLLAPVFSGHGSGKFPRKGLRAEIFPFTLYHSPRADVNRNVKKGRAFRTRFFPGGTKEIPVGKLREKKTRHLPRRRTGRQKTGAERCGEGRGGRTPADGKMRRTNKRKRRPHGGKHRTEGDKNTTPAARRIFTPEIQMWKIPCPAGTCPGTGGGFCGNSTKRERKIRYFVRLIFAVRDAIIITSANILIENILHFKEMET